MQDISYIWICCSSTLFVNISADTMYILLSMSSPTAVAITWRQVIRMHRHTTHHFAEMIRGDDIIPPPVGKSYEALINPSTVLSFEFEFSLDTKEKSQEALLV